MVGSSASIAGPNVALNTTVAAILDEIASRLENAKDFNAEMQVVLAELIKKHKRVIFNGNNYSKEWEKEAEKRGLPNVKSTVESLTCMLSDKNVSTFEKYNVLSKVEMESRFEIYLERYEKDINIEALTMVQMTKRQIMPAIISFTKKLADTINSCTACGADVSVQKSLLSQVSTKLVSLQKNLIKLEDETNKAADIKGDTLKKAEAYRDKVFTVMKDLRADADALEVMLPKDLWPMPTYAEILFLSC